MTNADLVLLWEHYTSDQTIVAVFEDIDNIFHGRVNTQARGDLNPITFDCLLNVLDGARARHGVLTMMTTNDESAIDPALIRPGRIDRVLDFPLPSREGRMVIVRKILGDEHQTWFEDLINKGEGMSGAEFQEMCRDVAQQLLWEKIQT
jgi:SpoVK/Ycf46/Vps4 family AAA+-type ATPase